MDALNRHREFPPPVVKPTGPPLLFFLVRSEGGAECARLQEANGAGGGGGGGYASATSPTPSQSQSPPPPPQQRARTRGGGRGEGEDAVVFKRDQGHEVQWGLGLVGGVSL